MSVSKVKIVGLAENKELENILRFDDFIKEENRREEKNLKLARIIFTVS